MMSVIIYSCVVVFDPFPIQCSLICKENPKNPPDYFTAYSNSLDLLGDSIVSMVDQRGCVNTYRVTKGRSTLTHACPLDIAVSTNNTELSYEINVSHQKVIGTRTLYSIYLSVLYLRRFQLGLRKLLTRVSFLRKPNLRSLASFTT
jgi:hypothetical protein